MTKHDKEVLNQLSKEQLIYLIEQFYHSQFLISETCVEESKQHISSERAVDSIRKYLYNMPDLYNAEETRDEIDVKMGRMSVEDYRKKYGFD